MPKKHILALLAVAVFSTAASATSYIYRQSAVGVKPAPAPAASTPPANCTTPWGAAVVHGSSVTAYQASTGWGASGCTPEERACANGTLTGSYAYQACTVTPNELVMTNGVRQWADGTAATSCAAYRNPTADHSYTGATGDGLYNITVNGTNNTAYCDMANGGWTLVAKGSADVNVAGWYGAINDYSVPANPSPAISATWKFGDAKINAIPKSAYRINVTGAYPGTYYVSGACTYGHQQTATGACATLYSNESQTTIVGNTAATAKGIANNQGSSYNVLMNNTADYAWVGWCAGNGQPGFGGCAAAGSRVSLTMWVK